MDENELAARARLRARVEAAKRAYQKAMARGATHACFESTDEFDPDTRMYSMRIRYIYALHDEVTIESYPEATADQTMLEEIATR
jgi:hypothetical protein